MILQAHQQLIICNMNVTLHTSIYNEDKVVVQSKPDKNQDKTVWHKINGTTYVLGYPIDHPKYAEWRKNAERQAKGNPIVVTKDFSSYND